jgi:hypothetical protein
MCFSIIAALTASSDVSPVGGSAFVAWIKPQRTIRGIDGAPLLYL